jgi:lipid-binding SYLF domain-containing protein
MRKTIALLATILFTTWCWSATDDNEKTIARLRDAADVLQSLVSAPDKGIPQEVLEKAKCIAVVPRQLKVGFVVGAEHGRGVATCRTSHGWSAPAFFTVTGGSWGAQIGLEGIDNVLVFMNQKGMDKLLTNKFRIGADASAAAGPVGRHASAGTDWKMDSEILSYSRAKGIFAGATLDGAIVKPDEDAMRAMYRRNVTFQEVLTGKVPSPPAAKEFLEAVENSVVKANAKS